MKFLNKLPPSIAAAIVVAMILLLVCFCIGLLAAMVTFLGVPATLAIMIVGLMIGVFYMIAYDFFSGNYYE